MNGPTYWNKLLGDVQQTWGRRGVVAGGAVRDWMLGVEPNDIDIFLGNSIDLIPQGEATLAVPDGWVFIRTLGREEYPGATDEFQVFEFDVDGTTVQVMFLRYHFQTHYRGFDNNLTKGAYWPEDMFGNGKLILDDALMYGLEHQLIYPLTNQGFELARMEEQRDRLNAVMPGWRIGEAPGAVPAVPAPPRGNHLLNFANLPAPVQNGEIPLRVVAQAIQ